MTDADREERARKDRERYHPQNPRDYASHIGMPYEDSETGETLYTCVGCWWCEPDASPVSERVADHERTQETR